MSRSPLFYTCLTFSRLYELQAMNIWIGKDLHIVQNTCKNGEEFNWVS